MPKMEFIDIYHWTLGQQVNGFSDLIIIIKTLIQSTMSKNAFLKLSKTHTILQGTVRDTRCDSSKEANAVLCLHCL